MIETKLSQTATPSSLVCFKSAREAFNRYAACNGDPRTEKLSPIECLQIDLMRWERKNFGLQPAYTSALGIVEEFGEFQESETRDQWIDAIGDIMVFASNLCTKNRLDMGSIIHMAESMIDDSSTWTHGALCGQLAHVTLKAGQGIRGYDDVDVVRRDTCIVIFRMVQKLSVIASPVGWTVGEILVKVGTAVMGRSWVSDALTGGEHSIPFEDMGTPPNGNAASRGRK